MLLSYRESTSKLLIPENVSLSMVVMLFAFNNLCEQNRR